MKFQGYFEDRSHCRPSSEEGREREIEELLRMDSRELSSCTTFFSFSFFFQKKTPNTITYLSWFAAIYPC